MRSVAKTAYKPSVTGSMTMKNQINIIYLLANFVLKHVRAASSCSFSIELFFFLIVCRQNILLDIFQVSWNNCQSKDQYRPKSSRQLRSWEKLLIIGVVRSSLSQMTLFTHLDLFITYDHYHKTHRIPLYG